MITAWGCRCRISDDLMGGMAVTGSNFAEIFARHAIQSVDPFSVIARGHQNS